jgi:uncharacterized protein YuzE
MVEVMNVNVEILEGRILAVHFSVREGKVAKTLEDGDGVQVDLSASGAVLGVEMLNPASVRIVDKIGRKRHIPELSRAGRELKRAFSQLVSAA